MERFDKNQERAFELLADHMESQGEMLLGSGNVVLLSLDYYITADRARYETKEGHIDLEGEVNVFKGNALYLKAQTVRLKLDSNYAFLEPFYLQDSSTGMWISASSADFSKDEYNFGESILSTCNANQPIWHIELDKGSYETQDSWMSLWGSRLYFYRYPVFYFPYLSFSAGYKRKSGLLYPTFIYSKDDGLAYNQPIFIAPHDSWDMTLSPQVRSKRGQGVFSEVRIADSQNNILWFNTGFFRNKASYREENNLKNRTHLGYQLKYQRRSLVQDYFGVEQDGLFIDFTHLNDIDYLRLQKEGESGADIRDKLLTSRLGYHLKGERDYLGFYAKYYIDLAKADNKGTLQTLPAIQYHRHTQPLWWDNLTYSADYQIKNLARREGYEVLQQELAIPLSYTQSLFDEYAALSLGVNFYATQANYRGFSPRHEALLKQGRFYSNHYTLALHSDLARPYADFFHTLHYEARYTWPGARERRGDFAEVLSLPGDREELSFKLSHYFYDKAARRFLYHRVFQPFYLQDSQGRQGDLENELHYYPNENWSLSSQILYSHDLAKVVESSHDINYTQDYFSAYLGHFFRHQERWRSHRDQAVLGANFWRAGFSRSFEDFTLFASVGYDFEEDYFRMWNVGVKKEVKCFSYQLRLANEIRPILTSTGAKPTKDQYVMFEFRFMPLLSTRLKAEQ